MPPVRLFALGGFLDSADDDPPDQDNPGREGDELARGKGGRGELSAVLTSIRGFLRRSAETSVLPTVLPAGYLPARSWRRMQIRTIRVICTVFAAGVLSASAVEGQDKAQIDHGIKVYAAQKCNVCHSIEGKGKKTGPLDGVGSKLSADEIRQWLVNAPEMTKKTNSKKKPVMKNYAKLPKEDIDALVAYMQTLKKS
jgi:mono/diheme cytochrome c family protein